MKNLNLLLLLRWNCFLLLIGRAWQHLFWDAPFRTLLWEEGWMKTIVEGLFGVQWFDYVTSPATDNGIQLTIRIFGLLYLAGAIIAMVVKKEDRILQRVLQVCSVGLVFLAFLYFKEKSFHVGQFFEYSAQFISPLLLIYVLRNPQNEARMVQWAKIAIAITFTAHGLYAVGYYPQPGTFVDMMIRVFGMEEPLAKQILVIMGVLDFVAAAALFIPSIARPFIVYCVVWGGMTAFARVVANFYWDFPLQTLNQNLYEVFYRTPHFILPFLIGVHYGIRFLPRIQFFSIRSSKSPDQISI